MDASPTELLELDIRTKLGESRMRYEEPQIEDYGSIADHTFSRCNPAAPNPLPVKGSSDVPYHIDNHLECSGLYD